LAQKARQTGLDVKPMVETVPVADLADRTETIVYHTDKTSEHYKTSTTLAFDENAGELTFEVENQKIKGHIL